MRHEDMFLDGLFVLTVVGIVGFLLYFAGLYVVQNPTTTAIVVAGVCGLVVTSYVVGFLLHHGPGVVEKAKRKEDN